MGQTLTHGVYLPDEGERNCYSGLAANWQILDTSVGTIAAHTAALAGKAPAVHTHTKADITDLFNSANEWTKSQQFNTSVKFSGQTGINWARGGNVGTLPSSVLYYGFQNALDSNDNVFDRIRSYVGTAGTNFQEHVKYAWNDLTKYVTINFWINADGSDSEYKLSVKRVIPGASNATDLGTSTNKWKTLNGVNPGALSLPSGGTTENTDWFNVAGDILPTGGNATDFTGGQNFFTPSKDGWLALSVASCESVAAWIFSLKYGVSVVAPNAGDNRQLIIPVVAGKQVEIKVKGSRWLYARLIVTQGNV